MNIEKTLELAAEKSLILKKQLNPIWEIILNFCKNGEINGKESVEIYEYVQYTEIHVLATEPVTIANNLVKEMSKISKFITVHTYLRGKECIISIDGRKTVFLYEKFTKGVKTNENNEDVSEFQRLLFMSRELYHPNLFLDVVKGKLNESQEIFLEIVVKLLSKISKTNGNNSDLSLDILGGRSKQLIVKKEHKKEYRKDFKSDSDDIMKYIKNCFKNSGVEYAFTSNDKVNNKLNEDPLRATSNDSWNIIKKLKKDLNKKFNSMKYDRFYYEISQNHIFNDFRFKRINLIDKRGNKVILSLYNNMEYESIPTTENNICHDFVKFRYIIYDICKREGTEEIVSKMEIENLVKTLKNGFDSCKKINELQYVGAYIDDRSVKINMGGYMKRNPLN